MENIVRAKSYSFAVKVVRLSRVLRDRREYELASQLVRAGTSIGANIEEAQAGVSRADFAAKMGIASRESRECHYWLRLLRDTGAIAPTEAEPLLNEAIELIRILTAIVRTAQSRKASQH